MAAGRLCIVFSSFSLIVAGAVDRAESSDCNGLECGVGADAFVQTRLTKIIDATEVEYCGWAVSPTSKSVDCQAVMSQKSTEYGGGSCKLSECKSLDDCEKKCTQCKACEGVKFVQGGGGGYQCHLVKDVSSSSIVDTPPSNDWGYKVNTRSTVCPPPTPAPTTAPTKASYNMEDCDAEIKRTGKFGTVVGAIDKIICSMKNQHKADQALIDKEVGRFAECAKLPDTDKEANDLAAAAKDKIPPFKKTKENKSEGNVPYDFGETKEESKAGADASKGVVDAKHKSFDTAHDALQKAEDAYAKAKKAAEEAEQQKIKEKKQCVCSVRSAYDDVFQSANDKWTKRRNDIKLLRTVKCTIEAGNSTSLVKCPEKIEEDLSPPNAKKSDVKDCELK